ncbi:hypothetical protein DFJ74DRAFT_326359 [Hyaloraphidium curvatum]|nr:hypothetical protein DFJ74DRAFT_326359 [Hyaloraphidium curvatum]
MACRFEFANRGTGAQKSCQLYIPSWMSKSWRSTAHALSSVVPRSRCLAESHSRAASVGDRGSAVPKQFQANLKPWPKLETCRKNLCAAISPREVVQRTGGPDPDIPPSGTHYRPPDHLRKMLKIRMPRIRVQLSGIEVSGAEAVGDNITWNRGSPNPPPAPKRGGRAVISFIHFLSLLRRERESRRPEKSVAARVALECVWVDGRLINYCFAITGLIALRSSNVGCGLQADLSLKTTQLPA